MKINNAMPCTPHFYWVFGLSVIILYRHTFAKYWLLRGGNIMSLQQVLGHKTLKMVQHYANLYPKDAIPKTEEFSILTNIPTTTGDTVKKRGKDVIKEKKINRMGNAHKALPIFTRNI